MYDLIAFDGDDTLWHNEVLYRRAQDELVRLLAPYAGAERVDRALYETEMRNLPHYGYGIKAFALSMIETAIALTDGQIRGDEIVQILGFAREMKRTPVRLLDGVEGAITTLSARYALMILTKGDLLDQEAKVAQSGLATCFAHVRVVSDKTEDTYRGILRKLSVAPQRFLMVGNSLRSDVLPVLAIGGRAVHIPYHVTWMHEEVTEAGLEQGAYVELAHIGLLPAWVEES